MRGAVATHEDHCTRVYMCLLYLSSRSHLPAPNPSVPSSLLVSPHRQPPDSRCRPTRSNSKCNMTTTR